MHSVQVPIDTLMACKFTYLEVGEPVYLHELGRDIYGNGNYQHYMESCLVGLLKVSFSLCSFASSTHLTSTISLCLSLAHTKVSSDKL